MRPEKAQKSHLKAFQRRLKNKLVIGFGDRMIVLNDQSWWKLCDPIPEAKRTDVCGRTITNVQIVRKTLELTLTRDTAPNDIKIYLHWINKDGDFIQPQFPVPGQPKASYQTEEDPILKEIDGSLDIIERLLKEYGDGSA